MADSHHDDCVAFFVKNYAPIADPQPHTSAAFQRLYGAMPGFGKCLQPSPEPGADRSGQLHPLPDSGWRKDDRPHAGI
jgi:hypothetical protein